MGIGSSCVVKTVRLMSDVKLFRTRFCLFSFSRLNDLKAFCCVLRVFNYNVSDVEPIISL